MTKKKLEAKPPILQKLEDQIKDLANILSHKSVMETDRQAISKGPSSLTGDPTVSRKTKAQKNHSQYVKENSEFESLWPTFSAQRQTYIASINVCLTFTLGADLIKYNMKRAKSNSHRSCFDGK